jgi:phosphatidylglycerophosphatase A
MKKLTKLFLSIFFVGYINFAPGTWGSLASIVIIFLLFNFLSPSLLILILTFIIVFFISNFLINYFSSFENSHDSKHIVIDEFLGIFFIFFFYDFVFIYNTFFTLLLIFLIFRFFDITKIFPANYIDKNYKNGFGVILDDIIAGIYTILTLVILNAFI